MMTARVIKDIFKALLEEYPMDQIRVTEICRQAGMKRQTFYYHFASIEDLMTAIIYDELSEEAERFCHYETWVEGYVAILEYCKKNKSWLLNIFNSDCREAFLEAAYEFGAKTIRRGISDCARDHQIVVSQEDREFMLNFYMSVFMDILKRFFASGMEEDPRKIGEKCNKMMYHSIRKSIKAFASLDV